MHYKISVLNDLESKLPTPSKTRYNTIKMKRASLKTLKSNKNIIIKPADKVGAIEVQNKEDHIQEGLRQLANTNHYKSWNNHRN